MCKLIVIQLISFFRMVFCIKDPEAQNLAQELTFVRCKDAWRTNSKRTPKR